jgi:hypothetical protein
LFKVDDDRCSVHIQLVSTALAGTNRESNVARKSTGKQAAVVSIKVRHVAGVVNGPSRVTVNGCEANARTFPDSFDCITYVDGLCAGLDAGGTLWTRLYEQVEPDYFKTL